MFLTIMVIGLVGLVMMAIPAFGRHGHAPGAQGHAGALGHGHGHGHDAGHLLGQGASGAGLPVHHGHAAATPLPAPAPASAAMVPHGGHHPAPLSAPASAGKELVPADTAPTGVLRFVPSPRAVFSVLALYGGFGNALIVEAHLTLLPAALLAAIPALVIERLLVRPLWNLLFRFQGQPSSSLDELLYAEAEAVVPFRNGRGLVSVHRDGRLVQLSARLRRDQAALPVKVGERLRIEDVDARRERVTVSVFRD